MQLSSEMQPHANLIYFNAHIIPTLNITFHMLIGVSVPVHRLVFEYVEDAHKMDQPIQNFIRQTTTETVVLLREEFYAH